MIKYIIPVCFLIFLGCGPREEKKLSAADSLRIELMKQADSLGHLIEIKPVTYSAYITRGYPVYKKLQGDFGDSAAVIILLLNKTDRAHLRRNDTLVVPDSVIYNWLYYSPFPLSLKLASDIPKLLFISQEIQAFAAYEYGVLVRWGPTSTGKRSTPTPNGLFHANWKAKETISTFDDEWLLKWSVNIDNFEGISIHEYAMPGYPASHACARLFFRDANWLYYWVQQWIVTNDEEKVIAYGTPVVIFGEYKYNGRRPHRNLIDNPDANKISTVELNKVLSQYINLIIQRQAERIRIVAERDSFKKKL